MGVSQYGSGRTVGLPGEYRSRFRRLLFGELQKEGIAIPPFQKEGIAVLGDQLLSCMLFAQRTKRLLGLVPFFDLEWLLVQFFAVHPARFLFGGFLEGVWYAWVNCSHLWCVSMDA